MGLAQAVSPAWLAFDIRVRELLVAQPELVRHRHSGIGYMTPAAVHHGQAQALFKQRANTLDAAFAAWINPPKKESDLRKKPTRLHTKLMHSGVSKSLTNSG